MVFCGIGAIWQRPCRTREGELPRRGKRGHHRVCRLYKLPSTRRCHGAPRSSRPTTGSDGGGGPVGHDHWACRLQETSLHTSLPRRAEVIAPYNQLGSWRRPCRARPPGVPLAQAPCTRRCHGAPGSSRPTGQAIHLLAPYRIGMDNGQFARYTGRHLRFVPTHGRRMNLVMPPAALCIFAYA